MNSLHMNSVMNKDVAMNSLDIAQHFNLAYTQLKIVRKYLDNMVSKLPIKFFYPTPIWQPKMVLN